jgi:hypothetical protein
MPQTRSALFPVVRIGTGGETRHRTCWHGWRTSVMRRSTGPQVPDAPPPGRLEQLRTTLSGTFGWACETHA